MLLKTVTNWFIDHYYSAKQKSIVCTDIKILQTDFRKTAVAY